MTVAELAMEKNRQIDRDVAFDLLLDRAGRKFGGLLTTISECILLAVLVMQAGYVVDWFPALLPISALPIAKAAAIMGVLLWSGYALFSLHRRSRLERELVQAQINLLRLQQLTAQS